MGDVGGSSGGMKAFGNRFMAAPKQASPEEKLRQVSDMYEKHFLREMTKAMRTTVGEGGFVKQNQAEKIFREQLDDKYVDQWGDKGGIGLSDMIYNQLIEKFGVRMGIKAPVAKPQGPLPLNAKSEYTAAQYTRPGNKEAVSVRFDKNLNGVTLTPDSREVKSPWDGVLLGKRSLGDDQSLIEIAHDNGLKSQMVFKGGVSNFSTGQKLQAGETLGFLSPEAKALYWSVESEAQPGPQTASE
ncbi:flagellar rod assembly protein/muramidase FlgJ [compost metagenome]